MKKVVIVSIVILFLISILLFPLIKTEYEIFRLKPYYQGLSKECREKGSFGCCFTSVKRMSAMNSKVMPDEGCQGGFRPNGILCIDSYKWCEPSK